MEEAVKRARASQAPQTHDAYTADEENTGGDPDNLRTVKMSRIETADQAYAERAVHTMKLGRIAEPSPARPTKTDEEGNSLWLPLSVAVALGLSTFLIVRYLL